MENKTAMPLFENSLDFARNLDAKDPLNDFRSEFLFPDFQQKPVIYFMGNSLGLQPKKTQEYVLQELEDWHKFGVEGHFMARRPWYNYHDYLADKTAKIVGAEPKEVVVTHSLTTNLHLLMVSFYRPMGKRTKILCEEKAFPSDQYALASQIKFHGLDPKEDLIQLGPRTGEYLIREEDILSKIDELGDALALVMMGGVNYFTGQCFDIAAITNAAHRVGAIAGFDMAHAAGNIRLHLHDWNVDFAAWCGYKYLNSSPGGVSGMFIHCRHAKRPDLPRFAGWWGHDKTERFRMLSTFEPMEGAEGWQLSNAPILGMAVHLASLDIFDRAGMDKIDQKRNLLTGFLEYIIDDVSEKHNQRVSFQMITPRDPLKRGAQLSIMVNGQDRNLFDVLTSRGVAADWREPNVIRVAPVPLYNSFEDCYRFGQILEQALQ